MPAGPSHSCTGSRHLGRCPAVLLSPKASPRCGAVCIAGPRATSILCGADTWPCLLGAALVQSQRRKFCGEEGKSKQEVFIYYLAPAQLCFLACPPVWMQCSAPARNPLAANAPCPTVVCLLLCKFCSPYFRLSSSTGPSSARKFCFRYVFWYALCAPGVGLCLCRLARWRVHRARDVVSFGYCAAFTSPAVCVPMARRTHTDWFKSMHEGRWWPSTTTETSRQFAWQVFLRMGVTLVALAFPSITTPCERIHSCFLVALGVSILLTFLHGTHDSL